MGMSMAELPRGTVTLVFTDIGGSTRLLHTLGDAYEDALATHRRLLRDALSSRGGIEVDTQGDALFYAFGRARDAIAGAIEVQRALASHDFGRGVQLRVRMGIHSGDPTVTAEGYVGADVHLAARICSAGHGGQVILSDATAQLAPKDLDGISLRSITGSDSNDRDEKRWCAVSSCSQGRCVLAFSDKQDHVAAIIDSGNHQSAGAERLNRTISVLTGLPGWRKRSGATISLPAR
jgi:hypothetical protein